MFRTTIKPDAAPPPASKSGVREAPSPLFIAAAVFIGMLVGALIAPEGGGAPPGLKVVSK
jgi:hypothetical protein